MIHLVVTMHERENWVFPEFILHRQIFSTVWILLKWPLMHRRDVWIPFGDMWGMSSVFVWVCSLDCCPLLRWAIFLQGRTSVSKCLTFIRNLNIWTRMDRCTNEWIKWNYGYTRFLGSTMLICTLWWHW